MITESEMYFSSSDRKMLVDMALTRAECVKGFMSVSLSLSLTGKGYGSCFFCAFLKENQTFLWFLE